MYCRNCGKEQIGTPERCTNCGAGPLAGNSYCQACGQPTNQPAEICIKCGARLVSPAAVVKTGGKSRTISILLAVFLGFCTWLYTYKRDGWKFWVGLGLAILLAIMYFTAIIGIVSENLAFIIGSTVSVLVAWLVGLGIWVWSIVDVAVKNRRWYSSY